MIPIQKLDSIFEELQAYRGDGRTDILFDSRDPGNYGAYEWDNTREMLRRADPSGLAEALLLHEMVEATIRGSKVVVDRVLREEGFLESVGKVLSIHQQVQSLIGDLRQRFMESLKLALDSISETFGMPDSREVAICLRDAIYCMDRGLKLRWLVCDGTPMREHVPLSQDVRQFANVAEFVDALRTSMPFGAHISRIGLNHTAIGIKQPGRIGYLSSMGIDTGSGKMQEHRANGHHLAESFDLDTKIERYPEWTKIKSWGGLGREMVIAGVDSHEMSRLSLLPRDRLIWLAMVVDMAAKKMAETDPATVGLTETLVNALPERKKSSLPVVIKPNWTVDALTLEGTMASFGFSEWEHRFLKPALVGLTPETFLPESKDEVGIDLVTRELSTWARRSGGGWSFSHEDFVRERGIMLTTVAEDWVGSKDEIDSARRQVLGRNLVDFLLAWGNRRFLTLWGEEKGWFEEKLRANLRQALRHSCVYTESPDYNAWSGVHLFTQNSQRKTYSPRCVFERKSRVTHTLVVHPNSSKDIVEVLALSSEEDLPLALQGWSRTQSWATSSRHPAGPYGTIARWDFRQRYAASSRKAVFEASVCVNEGNFDVTGIPARPVDRRGSGQTFPF